jgi:hypothetical protein
VSSCSLRARHGIQRFDHTVARLLPSLLDDDEAFVDARIGPIASYGCSVKAAWAAFSCRTRRRIPPACGAEADALRFRILGDARAFPAERDLLARLTHRTSPNFTTAASATPAPYFTLEHVEGEPITVWCDARARHHGTGQAAAKVTDTSQFATNRSCMRPEAVEYSGDC